MLWALLIAAPPVSTTNCDTVEDIAFWARKKESWLRQFLVLKNGIRSEDTFLRIFRALDPKHFETAFRRWASCVVGALSGKIAGDGKTMRGSGSDGEGSIYMVCAFATELGVVLGQEKLPNKSSEITAIPELLDALCLKSLLVSIDVIGCQKGIGRQITSKVGDYLLMVKGTHPALLAAVETAVIDTPSAPTDRHQLAEKPDDRVVGQITSVLPAKGIVDAVEWPQSGRIYSVRWIAPKESALEQLYYISSRDFSAERLAAAVKAHWAIEKRLCWVLDDSFGADGCRKDNALQNLSLLKKIVLNIVRTDAPHDAKASLHLKRKAAAWNEEVSMNVLGLRPLC